MYRKKPFDPLEISWAQQLNGAQLEFLVIYSVGMVLQILLPNYAGTNVVEHCDKLAIGACSSDWFELEPIELKSFSIISIR